MEQVARKDAKCGSVVMAEWQTEAQSCAARPRQKGILEATIPALDDN